MIENEDFTAVILADGEYPTHTIPLKILNKARHLICCDGAALHYHGRIDAIIGDGDSLSEDFKTTHKQLFHHVAEQEDNDLTKATRYVVTQKWEELPRIAYIGATGKREDHTLGNISLMMRYFNDFGIVPTLLTNYGWMVPAKGVVRFNSFARQQVSIFNFTCRQLRSSGLRWDSYAYQSWWQGTLNEAVGNSFTLDGDGTYLVFRTYDPKDSI